MAPGLIAVRVYEAPANGTDYVDILKQMEEDDLASQLSSSVEAQCVNPGLDPNADVVYQEFAMQGQSYFQASGDNGGYYPGVPEWADDPYITLVGGTSLSTANSGNWFQEIVWNGSGGGTSTSYLGNYPVPTWQQGVSMSSNGGSTTMRNVPDVAMLAANIYLISNNGSNSVASGTSAATPLWAGFTALVNQQAVTTGQPTVGFSTRPFTQLVKGQTIPTASTTSPVVTTKQVTAWTLMLPRTVTIFAPAGGRLTGPT